MKKLSLVFLILSCFVGGVCDRAWPEDKVITMSTTTSTQASGLLEVLLPEFKKDTGIEVKVVAKGTGAALRDGQDGNVDVVFVHDPEREEAFVSEGFGVGRYAVMHNDFILVGPAEDPAGLKGVKDAVEAFKKIAAAGSRFVSRGDDSGTHAKEMALWRLTGLPLKKETVNLLKEGRPVEIVFERPGGDWYLSIGQGMGKTLVVAEEKQAYTLTDRGTYIKFKFGQATPISLEILVEGDERLHNPYGVIPVNPRKHPHVRFDSADRFARWLVSPRGQALIAGYKLHGRRLFFPDALPEAE